LNPASFALILCGVFLNACAQLLLKAGVNNVTAAIGTFEYSVANVWPVGIRLATQWPIIGGLACYVVSVVVWILGLSRVEVSVAYPLLSLGYVLNAVLAWWLFNEALNPTRIAGIGIIIVGVYVLTRSA
jgi:multidrug transporter EmrE-like cation transporter